jgi:hypothetical protein
MNRIETEAPFRLYVYIHHWLEPKLSAVRQSGLILAVTAMSRAPLPQELQEQVGAFGTAEPAPAPNWEDWKTQRETQREEEERQRQESERFWKQYELMIVRPGLVPMPESITGSHGFKMTAARASSYSPIRRGTTSSSRQAPHPQIPFSGTTPVVYKCQPIGFN